MSLNMGYAASQVLLNALVSWGLTGTLNAPELLDQKKKPCLCFQFPHQTVC